MKTIIVKTQAELDALPENFDEYTVIEIRSDPSTWITVTKARESSRVVARESSRVVARGSSRVVARESSRVVALGSSSVEAWGSSSVEALGSSSVEALESSRVVARESSRVEARESSSVESYDFSMIAVLSPFVLLKKLMDYAVASIRDVDVFPSEKSDTATVIKTPRTIERTFEQWLEQGYVHADGITKKLISSKKIGDTEVFTVEEFLDRKESYVVKRGDIFSHGETVEKAIEGLRYKLIDRDTSRFKHWSLDDMKSVEEIIQAYRAITGACEYGVRQFCEGKRFPEYLTIHKAIELTEGHYGNQQFKEFFV